VTAHQFSRAEKEAARDRIRPGHRAGEIVAVMGATWAAWGMRQAGRVRNVT
jgi:hypothetical protein